MIRKFVLAAALAAVAAPAFAATSVTVNVAGLDAKAAQAKIWTAAKEACKAEVAGLSETLRYYNYIPCAQRAAASVRPIAYVTSEASQRPTATPASPTGR